MRTRNDNELERHEKIDKAIEESIEPSPDSANAIAEKTGEHVTLVVRRLRRNWSWFGGRWKRRQGDE